MDSRSNVEMRKNIIDYVVCHTKKLTNFTLNKMVYLVEVSYFIQNQRRLTDINFVFDDYGPYSRMVRETAEESDNILVKEGTTRDGVDYIGFDPKEPCPEIVLPADVKDIADSFISEFGSMPLKERAEKLKDTVYSTAPLTKTKRNDTIDFSVLKPKYRVNPAIREARSRLMEKMVSQ